jgi:hypothetical protein
VKKLLLVLLLTTTPALAQNPVGVIGDTQTLTVPPLSDEELRDILLRLNQLTLSWERQRLLQETIVRSDELIMRERELISREKELAVAAERANTAQAEAKMALEKNRADFYEMAFHSATKGRSAGCWVAKIFTIGLAHCQ